MRSDGDALWFEEDGSGGYAAAEGALTFSALVENVDNTFTLTDRHGMERALVMGVVRRESNFDPDARGDAGEYGLMQVTRIAARDWERVNKRTIRFDRDLFDPELNVEVGTWYLSQGWKRYRGHPDQTILALSYYNAGPGRASEWSKKYKENLLERIPFSSTREYISSVCDYRDNYRKKAAYENRLAKD